MDGAWCHLDSATRSLNLAGVAEVPVGQSTQAVGCSASNRPKFCTLHRVMMAFVIKWLDVSCMSILYIVLPPHCTKYPCLSSHHFLIVPLTACTFSVHYSSLCCGMESMPGCSAATSLRFTGTWDCSGAPAVGHVVLLP